MFSRLLYSILLQMFMVQPLLAQEPIWVFEDTTASLTIEDVAAMPEAFVQTTDTNIGFSDSAFWIRVELTNGTDEWQTQVVQFDSHALPIIEAYEGIDIVASSGRSIAKTERPMPTILPSFPIELEPHSAVTRYFKIASTYDISLGYQTLGLNQAIASSDQFGNFLLAATAGLTVLLVYNTAAAIIIRQRLHWLYVGFVTAMLSVQIGDAQLVNVPINYLSIFGPILVTFGMLFLALLFDQLRYPAVRWGITCFVLYYIITLSIFGLDIAYQLAHEVTFPLGILFWVAQIITAVIQKRPHSGIAMVGWGVFFTGGVLTLLALRGTIPFFYATAHTVGSLVEAICFSIILSYRLRQLDQTEELLEEQRQTNERQKEMFAVIGHELRTPVAAISMIGRDTDTDAESAREQIVDISDNLLSVLEDLRVVVSPERAMEAKSAEVCDPVRTISRALSPVSQLMKQHSIGLRLKISKPEGANFLLHAQPLRQLVTNLTKNAAIHSGGSVVQVSFDYQQLPDGSVVGSLTVEDDGKGIPESLREKVFEPFGRGDTKRDGSGLGLFIVKEIASLLGGTLEYSTSQLGGSCFTLAFPMKRVEIEEKPQANNVSLEGLRILLAEDEGMLRMLSEKLLTKHAAIVSSFENGQLALDAFDPAEFDLVLTDLMMPEMDGHALTAAIRETGATTPIIAVTAAVVGDETDQVLYAGADGFISKPISPEKLIEALNALNEEVICG